MLTRWWLFIVIAVVVGAAYLSLRASPLSLVPTSSTVTLWSSAEIKCNDMVATFWLWNQPVTAKLTIDTNPSAPNWPFYYGAISAVVVNGFTVKTYNPPLTDTDTLDITEHVRSLAVNEVKVVPKVAAILCNIQTQGTLSGHVELTFPQPGDGGGGGGGGGSAINIVFLMIGLALLTVGGYFMVRRRV